MAKVGRQTSAWKVIEEMIGVPVPRKACLAIRVYVPGRDAARG